MAAPSLGKSFCASCSGVAGWNEKVAPLAGGTASSSMFSPWRSESRGQQVVLGCLQTSRLAPGDHTTRVTKATKATSVCVPRSMRWWEKGTAPNMTEIGSAQELVDSLLGAGDRLVVVDFYSPGCGGCKALHPKICQFADSNPDALFLKVNYEEHKSMCYGLNVHVLPFFRFYRGAQGRVCSFSCTNATIKKFKDAMAKHGSERRDLGPAKGLEESELLKLVSNGDLQFDLPLVHSRVNDLANNLCGSLRGVAQEAGEEMAALAL